MNDPFFQKYGDNICFRDNSDLASKLSKIDCSVPRRTQGRKSYHRERYCIKHYLLAFSNNNLLKFPISITKGESPDFIIVGGNNNTLGLEHTDAGTENYQRAMTKLAKSPPGTMLEGTRLVKPGEKLMGAGWIGDSAEREWAKTILNAIRKKTDKLNQSYFKFANRYELLIYDDTCERKALHIRNKKSNIDGLGLLQEAIRNEIPNLKSFKRNFDCISVITKSDELLLYDVANKGLVLNVITDDSGKATNES